SLGIKFDRPYFWPVPNPPADWVAHPISKSSQPQRSNLPTAPPRVAPPFAAPAAPARPAPPPPPPASSISAPVASSSNTVKEINDAVSRAVTITSKLDALVQTLPAQLEARLKEKAEEAAKAAQVAAVARIEKQLEGELKRRAADVHLDNVGQCT